MSSSPTSLAELRELLREIASGGVVITEPLDPLLGLDGGDPEVVGLRTVVQLDGDLAVTIHPRLLESPDFAAIHARHLERVEARFGGRIRRLRRLIDGAGWLAALGGATTTLAVGVLSGAEVGPVLPSAGYVAAALIVAAALALFVRALLRRALDLDVAAR